LQVGNVLLKVVVRTLPNTNASIIVDPPTRTDS
jgi:hypothetical protein